ncbi:MAG: hypothetical protein EOM26_11235 [Alphaproteobacteria bacterium]|nr:hypothetical protein [Alphaproteobacteria bacterium]
MSQKEKTLKTQTVSVRLPSPALREALSSQCAKEGITISFFLTTAVQAFVDGRLRIIEPAPESKPTFFVEKA